MKSFVVFCLSCFVLVAGARAADNVVISEFMARNTTSIVDEDNSHEDWVEVYNPGGTPVNLAGWRLTDNAANLSKWIFPTTNIAAGKFLIVWASNKNRREPGAPLHTNFRLSDGGEYLALVRPDNSIATEFAPAFPQQVQNVSYGLSFAVTNVTFLTTGATAKVFIPANDALGSNWLDPAFNDAGWAPATMPVGFVAPFIAAPLQPGGALLADSVTEFSGVQGQDNWFYGFYDRTADGNATYDPNTEFNTTDPNWGFSGGNWVLGAGGDLNANPPWDTIGSTSWHPNGINNAAEHWVVRRWVSEVSGVIHIAGTLVHPAASDGTRLHVIVDGTELGFFAVANSTTEFAVNATVSLGSKVDFALDAGAAAQDGADSTTVTFKIYQNILADSVADWSATGIQGARGWSYGYFNRTSGAVSYTQGAFTPFTRGTLSDTTISAGNHWDGTQWNLSPGSPGPEPYTEIAQTTARLTATTNAPFPSTGGTNWPVRRWTSTYSGPVRVSGIISHTTPSVAGLTALAVVDGATLYTRTFNSLNLAYSFVATVTVGSKIDFVVSPNTTNTNDVVTFTATVQPVAASDITQIADSATDWSGGQGGNGWYFGFYNRTADGDATYNATTDFVSNDPLWTFASSTWQLGVPGSLTANPPWTDVSQFRQHPNGTNQVAPNEAEHWPIRRWVSKLSGTISIGWHIGKQSVGGNGTTLLLMQNGVVRDTASISGTDMVGANRLVSLDVRLGDFIDFALTPYGPGGMLGDDVADGTYVNAYIYGRTAQTTPLGTVIADSSADWSATGGQGFRNWYYGFYNKTFDGTPGYQTNDFILVDPNWSFTGGIWQLGTNGNPTANAPWDNIGQTSWHPNGTNSVYLGVTNEHWAVRRWISSISGTVRVEYFVAKQAAGGNGTTTMLFQNGLLRDAVTIANNNVAGERRAVSLTLQVGDYLDFALSPLGTDFTGADGSDGSLLTAQVLTPLSLTNLIATDLRPLMHNSNATAYLRVPFNVTDPGSFDLLKLRMKYDDGFVAYLNGVMVARRSAPTFAVGGLFAESTNDWSTTGVQGFNNWSFGFYNRTADANLGYDPFSDFNTTDPNWAWNGSAWALGPSDPPWTTVSRDGWHPNGINNSAEHWAIRRWVSEANGNVTARLFFAKQNLSGAGTTLRVFVNGIARFTRSLAGNDGTGVRTNLLLEGLLVGDLVDFALDPLGSTGDTADGSDGSYFGVIIDQQVSGPLTWNSAAIVSAPASAAQTFEEFDISSYRGFLNAGPNVLAIQGLNVAADDPDFFLLPELVATTVDATSQPVYFTPSTPNAINAAGTTNLGPVILEVNNVPKNPCDFQDIYVTAMVERTFDPIGSVTLFYRVNYAAEVGPVAMLDDGLHQDGVAGDGVYGATIPQNTSTNGQMVRWRIVATDSTGDFLKSPPFDDPINSPEYWGTVIANPLLTNNLPVLHWFTQNPAGANATTGARGSIYFNGQFLDNIGANLHGQSSGGFPKKSYDFDMNRGFKLTWKDGQPAVDDFNLLTFWADKTFMRDELGYQLYADAGVPAHFAFTVRVQQNGAFFSVAGFVENGDDNFLKRLGFDDQGALYKMYNTLNSATSGAEKKTRKTEANTDLQQFISGLSSSNPSRHAYMFDNVNLPEVINYWATRTLTADTDWGHKNYYLYRDSLGSREWQVLPWDIDLSLGHNWTGQYFDDNIVTNSSLFVATGNNTLFTNLFANPITRGMYWRRLRSLVDDLLQTNGTPRALDKLQAQMDRNAAEIRPDVALDVAKWGTWNHGSSAQVNIGTAGLEVLNTNLTRMSNVFLTGWRAYLNNTTSAATNGPIPPTQIASPTVTLWSAEVSPANSNQDQEWIAVTNREAASVDISGWKLDGGVRFTFAPGTVLPSNGVLYVARHLVQWRARTVSPKGGETNFVVGPFSGTLDARGEGVTLANKAGSIVSSNFYGATPSAAQLYLRVTELMYNPPPGGAFDAQEYEFLELKNISGAVDIDLVGVHFVDGIQFNFTATSPVTNLAPGARIVLVKNLLAFAARYPAGPVIAGRYTNSLDNAGERVLLLDAAHEEILDFTYDNNWYEITDGAGFSLVIVNENAAYTTWDQKASWRPSGSANGSPGGSDTALPAIAGILVNEVLTHTDLPAVDQVELFNPTASDVNIGGWFITDDFGTPKKFRIPNGTMITSGGYRVFTETNFNPNPGVPPSFSFGATGDEVFLFSGDANTNLTGYVDGFDFGAAENGVSFGRQVDSQGGTHYVAQSATSFGGPNAGPQTGPVIVSEIMYHPPDNADGTDNFMLEYIELHNNSTAPVPLFDPANPSNTWRLDNAVEFHFPSNFTLGACANVVVVGFDPVFDWLERTAFTNHYPLAPGTTLLGPWTGRLDNSTEGVELKKPDSPNGPVVPYVLVEKISYADTAPWASADGNGLALRRSVFTDFGNDATNWTAGAPTPGVTPPVIGTHPSSVSVAQGSSASLSVVACGPPPVAYQWRFHGTNLPGATNATLSFTPAQFTNDGSYDVVLSNAAGALTSLAASLIVFDGTDPVVICPGPTNVQCNALGGAVLNFTVAVTDNHDAGLVAACVPASGSTFPVGATTVHCAAMDAGGNSGDCSFIVTVSDATPPVIIAQPQSRTNLLGTTAIFSVTAEDCTALTWQWFRGVSALVDQTNATLTLANVQLADQAAFSVQVTSAGGTTTSATATLTVNRAPLAGDNGGTTAQGDPADFSFGKLLRNDSDPDGDPLAVMAVTSPSLHGGAVVIGAGSVTYTPLAAFTGSDRFSYTIGDGRGGTATANVEVFVSDGTALSLDQLSMALLPNGHVLVRFLGVPGRSYVLQRSTNLTNWSPLATVVAPEHGVIEYEDTNPPGGGAFYRMALP